MGVVQFIESLDRTSLTISDEEFEKNVEAAVSAIAEKDERHDQPLQVHVAEKSSLSRPEVTRRHSMEGEHVSPRKSTTSRDGGYAPGVGVEDQAAVTGLLRTIQKPLSSIGRIFSDDSPRPMSSRDGYPSSYRPQAGNSQQRSPALQRRDRQPPSSWRRAGSSDRRDGDISGGSGGVQDRPLDIDDAAARQASVEVEETRRMQRLEHSDVVEYVLLFTRHDTFTTLAERAVRTLSGMFPGLDRDLLDDVVREKQGRHVTFSGHRRLVGTGIVQSNEDVELIFIVGVQSWPCRGSMHRLELVRRRRMATVNNDQG